MIFDKIDKNRKDNMKKRSVKEYRRFDKKGIIVMVVVMAIWALIYRDPYGNTLYGRIIGNVNERVVHSTIAAEDAAKIKILIDAGHGGFDNGAISSYVDKTESELNLEVAQRLRIELEDMGFKVEMTRPDENALGDNKDADMAKRKSIIFESDADILVSIHMNTHQNKSVNGPIVFYMPGSAKGNELANLIQASMNDELLPKNAKSSQSQNFLVLRAGDMPGVLVECGFISNKTEGAKLGNESYQKRIAQSIAWGIMDYFANLA